MKNNTTVSGGKLKESNYQSYADYLANFYEAYEAAGINVYGISPSNEPGYAAPWNSCLWTAEEMGKFAVEYLAPTFAKRNVKAKMILGENPLWSVKFQPLVSSSSADFVRTIVEQHPDLSQSNIIFAGHGYTLPDTIKQIPTELLETPIIPLLNDKKNNMVSTWVTEISDVTPIDLSMEDGLNWAKTFHKYLTVANVNAIVWWAGAQPTSNNESLIILNKDRIHFDLSKRYEVFGNYSRYIPVNSKRIQSSHNENDLYVTCYKKDNQCIWVVINDADYSKNLRLSIDNDKNIKSLYSYSTNENQTWSEKKETVKKGTGLVSIPAKSVVSYIGILK